MNRLKELNIKPTMSSLEIVEYINQERKEKAQVDGVKFKELRHDNFMQKVPKVIGDLLAPKFLGTNKGMLIMPEISQQAI